MTDRERMAEKVNELLRMYPVYFPVSARSIVEDLLLSVLHEEREGCINACLAERTEYSDPGWNDACDAVERAIRARGDD